MHEVTIPVLDQTGDEVVLTLWLKREGDAVTLGEAICEVETAKALVEIQAEAGGILRKQLIEAGRPIPMQTVVALIGGADEPLPDIDPFARVRQGETNDDKIAPPPAVGAEERPHGAVRIMASPRAKRLAVEHGIDLQTVSATGSDGSIVEADIRLAIERAAGASSAGSAARVATAKAQAVTNAWQTIPHFWISVTVDLERIVERKAADGASVTYTDYVASAVAEALQAVPDLNGHWTGNALQVAGDINLGIVVETERGLVIPVLRDVRRRSLLENAAERARLVEQAHAGRLSADALTGATFTVSNVGPGTIESFTAIISPPQVGILAVGSIQRRPIVAGDQLTIRSTATMTLGADHRAIDGRRAAAFLEQLKRVLEA